MWHHLLTESISWMDHCEQFYKDDYILTDQDILRVRTRTTGIWEQKGDYLGATFSLFVLGGGRSERRKWLHALPTFDISIFLVSLQE